MKKTASKIKKTPAEQIGARLRSLRGGRKLTLEQLSRMAGVSKAMLSQIEQEKVNPTVAVMIKIADALKISVSELIDQPGQATIFRVIRAGEDKYTYRSDPACTIRTLSPLSLEKSIEFYRISLEAGGELPSESHFPGTEEFLYVERGKLAVTSGEDVTQLSKGDAAHYRADLPHTIHNSGKGRADAYMIVHYRRT